MMLGDEVEQIITFIKKSDNGRRWVDLEREFKKRGWSKGKFVNHWKKTESFREQRPTKTGKKYFIKDSHNKEATKLVLAKDLKEQELLGVKISSKFIVDYFYNLIKNRVDSIRQSWNPRSSLRGEKGEFFCDCYAYLLAKRYSQFIKINISYPKGQITPNINSNFKIRKDRRGLEILMAYFTKVAGEYQDENKNPLPFQLLLIHDPPLDDNVDLRKHIEEMYDFFYNKWVNKFPKMKSKQTKDHFTRELANYLPKIDQLYRKKS